MIWLFWVCAFLMVYVYVGYPVLARVLGKLIDRKVQRGGIRPTVTVIVTAYNEQKGIKTKLDNLLQLDYPAEQIDVLVASDASSDDTDAIVRGYGDARSHWLLSKRARQDLGAKPAVRPRVARSLCSRTPPRRSTAARSSRWWRISPMPASAALLAGSSTWTGKFR